MLFMSTVQYKTSGMCPLHCRRIYDYGYETPFPSFYPHDDV